MTLWKNLVVALVAAFVLAAGAAAIGDVGRDVTALQRIEMLHAGGGTGDEDSLATERTVGKEREVVALW